MISDRLGNPLTDGQVVTLLVGLGLQLAVLHRRGQFYGSLHPAHVECSSHGRPMLRLMAQPDGQSVRDDVLALLRLGAALGGAGGVVAKACRERVRQESVTREAADLASVMRWLLTLAPAQPLARPGLSDRGR